MATGMVGDLTFGIWSLPSIPLPPFLCHSTGNIPSWWRGWIGALVVASLQDAFLGVLGSGGVAALNHRLPDVIPPGSMARGFA